jgi:spore germination protein GerM
VGVTPKESDAGFSSAFSTYTAGQLRSATIENRIATLELTAGFRDTSNYSATGASMAIMQQLEATVFHFPDIDGLEFEIDGERWCFWENPCEAGVPVPLFERP